MTTQPEALRLATVLENKLGGAADEDIEQAAAELRRLHELSLLVKEFFENYLNVVEESESGKAFNPVGISCCRAHMLQPLDNLLHRMRLLSGAKPNPLGDCDE